MLEFANMHPKILRWGFVHKNTITRSPQHTQKLDWTDGLLRKLVLLEPLAVLMINFLVCKNWHVAPSAKNALDQPHKPRSKPVSPSTL